MNDFKIISEPEGKLCVDFSEIYRMDGSTQITAHITLPGGDNYAVDFDNPLQVLATAQAFHRYLERRNTFQWGTDEEQI